MKIATVALATEINHPKQLEDLQRVVDALVRSLGALGQYTIVRVECVDGPKLDLRAASAGN
ncbi:MAG TPA: hypothetical protein VGI39_34320 [Polyangiaceae bacterium]|jgi:hypothetical protein